MDKRSLKVLEYPKILEILKGHCVSEGAKERASSLVPYETVYEVERALGVTSEALNMMLRNGRPPLSEIKNTSDYVHRASIGAMLSMKELLAVASLLRIVKDMENYYYNDTQFETLDQLKNLFTLLAPCEELEKEISHKILSEGEMADNASRELSRIRR